MEQKTHPPGGQARHSCWGFVDHAHNASALFALIFAPQQFGGLA